MRYCFAFILIPMIFACGRGSAPASLREETAVLFDHGRFHRFFPKQNATTLQLVQTHEELQAVDQLADSPYASWLRFDTRMMPDIQAAALPEQLNIVAQKYGDSLGQLQADEWIPAERFMRRDESRLFLNYLRRVRGLPVRDNVLQLVLVENEPGIYRLSEVQSNITGPAPDHLDPALPAPDVGWLEDLTGRSDLLLDDSYFEWIPFLEEGQFHWQKAVVFIWTMGGENYQATLLPEEAVWLDAYPLAAHAKPVLSRALKRSYAEDGLRDFPLAFSAVNGPSGNYALGAEAYLPSDFSPSRLDLNGSRATVLDAGAAKASSYKGIEEKEANFVLTAEPNRLAAVNAFVAVQRINRFARQFLSVDDAPFLDQSLVVNVNLVDQSCNAYYSPKQQRLLLYKEGLGCANMALLNDVIYHEWAHALDDHVGRNPGILDAAFSEGLADVTAAFYNDDPAIAPFFVFDDPRPIRRLTDERVYPDDIGAIHYEGGIIASTFWELRLRLIERYGANRGAHTAGRLFFRHLLAVDSYQESYAAVLRVDDDDRNPATPGPNHCLINAVFAKHGLASAENCEDMVAGSVSLIPELNIALLDAGPAENAVHVLASAPEAEAMALCMGPRLLCEASRASWIMLKAVGHHPSRSYFMSVQPLLLPQLTQLTLLRLDSQAQLRDSRELKVFAK